MSGKKLNYILLLIFIVTAGVYLKASNSFLKLDGNGSIDAGYFPRIIGVLLIVFCVISFIQTLRSKEYEITIGDIHFVLISIAMTAAYFWMWGTFGMFYPLTFVFMLSLFILLRPRPIFGKGLILSIALSAFMTIFIYFVFDKLMSVQF